MELGNVELLYSILDESVNILDNNLAKNYFELIIDTSKNILAQKVLQKIDIKEIEKLLNLYKQLEDINFSIEDLRKAYQILILKGFKKEKFNNSGLTPDMVGIFMAYLISRLIGDKSKIKVLDPVIGCGNLLYTVANHLNCELELMGVDLEENFVELASLIGELLEYKTTFKTMDTLTTDYDDIDFIVCDLPEYEIDNQYFPYLFCKHYLNSLADDGFLISLVPENFLSYDHNGSFKEELKENGSILAILKLPEELFIGAKKDIIIFTKNKENKKCLLLEIPSFSDRKALNNILISIEKWFDNWKEGK